MLDRMKVKVSITLSPEVLASVDAYRDASMSRSRAIEQLMGESLERRERELMRQRETESDREARREREIAILNEVATADAAENEAFIADAVSWWELGRASNMSSTGMSGTMVV